MAHGIIQMDLSKYPYIGTRADLSKIHSILGGIVLDCSPVKATNIKKLGIDTNMKICFVKKMRICAYFEIFFVVQKHNFSFKDRF